MTRVLILLEGQTEETFTRNILQPYFSYRGVYLEWKIVVTKRTKSGQTFKGGITSYARLRRDVLRLCGDTNAAAITTMLDYYGLPDDFPGKNSLQGNTPYQRVAFLENAFANDIGKQRFIPFLTLHEFEALLFARPQEIISAFPDLDRHDRSAFEREIQTLPQPEEIDEGAQTHPAKRISRHIRAYRKTWHGPLIAQRIGLLEIRQKCPHFNNWLVELEHLGTVNASP